MTHKLFNVNILDSENICIESLSFSTCGTYLAVSYSNNISIYEVKTQFHLKTLTDPDVDASFRSTIWVPFNKLELNKLVNYRLFSIGLHGIIVEWDLRSFKQKRQCASFGGAIFSGIISPFSDLIVTCDDGCVRSFTIWSSPNDGSAPGYANDELVFNRNLIKHTYSILSICCSKENFFCGTANSQILICTYNSRNYKMIKVSSAPSERAKRPVDLIGTVHDGSASLNVGSTITGGGNCNIWSLVYVDDKKVLISGDSLGNVSIWDLNTLTMLQTFSDSKNDIISLVMINSNLLISASLQGKVVLYSYNRGSATNSPADGSHSAAGSSGMADLHSNTNSNRNVKWFINGFKYPLKGSIHCLSIYSAYGAASGSGASVTDDIGFLICGGDFGCIYCTKTHKFLNNKTCKLIYPVINSFNSHIQMNSGKNILISQHAHDVNVWSIPNDSADYTDDLSINDRNSGTDSSANGHVATSGPLKTPGNSFGGCDADREICKMCRIQLKRDSGRIVESCLSPHGDILAILNESGLRIILVNNLEVSQIKFNYNQLAIITMCFLSNNELLVHHYDKNSPTNYCISSYNIGEGTMELLDYLDMNETIIKMVVPDNLNGPKHAADGDANRWGVLYGLDNCVYCVDFIGRSYFKLPQIVGARITSVAFNGSRLLAFSSSFKYYIYDLPKRAMVEFRGQLVHKIPSKVTNMNALVLNAHWILSWVIVQTTHNIFYFKLSSNLDGEPSVTTPTSTNPNAAISVFNGTSFSPGNVLSATHSTYRSNKSNKLIIGPRRLYNVPSIEHYVYKDAVANGISNCLNASSDPRSDSNLTNDTNLVSNHSNATLTNSSLNLSTNASTNRSTDIELVDSDTSRLNYINLVKNKFIVHADVLVSSTGGRFDANSVAINIIAFKRPVRDDFVRTKKYGQ